MTEFQSYVARCRGGCGALRLAMVDDPSHASDTAKEIAKAIRQGYVIERMSTPEVRTAEWTCTCEKPGAPNVQAGLFDATG